MEQSIANILASMNLESTGGKIATFIVTFAADLAKLFDVLKFIAGVVGFLLFVWALFDLKALGKANSPGITGGGTLMKIIFSSAMGVFHGFMQMASMSLLKTSDPTSPMSYIDKAESIQQVSPFTAMLFAVLSIVTLLGWFYGLKAVYLFSTVNGKQDKEAHVMQAANMLLGSTLMINLSVAVMGFFASGGVEVSSFGDF
jgi:hypothetical protein